MPNMNTLPSTSENAAKVKLFQTDHELGQGHDVVPMARVYHDDHTCRIQMFSCQFSEHKTLDHT